MRQHAYTKFSAAQADAVDLQSLLDQLADFLLQSGFAGGDNGNPYYGEIGDEDGDQSLDALREAILAGADGERAVHARDARRAPRRRRR